MSFREAINGTTAADRFLLVLLLSLSLLGGAFVQEVLPKGGDVSIEVDGKTLYRYPIDTDRSLKVEGVHGHLTVEIRDKRVRVIEASCPNKYCEYQGWVIRGAIVCLPSRIVVTVGDPERQRGRSLDAITG